MKHFKLQTKQTQKTVSSEYMEKPVDRYFRRGKGNIHVLIYGERVNNVSLCRNSML